MHGRTWKLTWGLLALAGAGLLSLGVAPVSAETQDPPALPVTEDTPAPALAETQDPPALPKTGDTPAPPAPDAGTPKPPAVLAPSLPPAALGGPPPELGWDGPYRIVQPLSFLGTPQVPACFAKLEPTGPMSDQPLPIYDACCAFIDNAIPGFMVRVRGDGSANIRRPDRAQYIWAPTGPNNPGPPRPERDLNLGGVSGYLEYAPFSRLSFFIETPWRFTNPDFNANEDGFSDMNLGFKYALWQTGDKTVSFQFKGYLPTGEERRGLGNGLGVLEPGLLCHYRVNPLFALDAELRYWAPVHGRTQFASDILRYGLGASFRQPTPMELWWTPVFELVGWTVLSGKQSFPNPNRTVTVKSAGGNTILDISAGARLGWADYFDTFLGFTQTLTGDSWWQNAIRVELRVFY